MKKEAIHLFLVILLNASVSLAAESVATDACKFTRGWNKPSVGLILKDYGDSEEKFKVDGITSGAVVDNILIGSSADIGNIPIGVVITKVDGELIDGPNNIQELIGRNDKKYITIEYVGNNIRGKRTLRIERASDKAEPCRPGEKKYHNERYPNPPEFIPVKNIQSISTAAEFPDVCLNMESVNSRVFSSTDLCQYVKDGCEEIVERIRENYGKRLFFLNRKMIKTKPINEGVDVTLYCERKIEDCNAQKLWLEDQPLFERIVNRKLHSISKRQSIQIKDGVTKKEHEVCGRF